MKISENLAIEDPNLHDGYLMGINVLPEKSIELVVAEVGGRRHRIVLEGVLRFNAIEFREGNIIFDVTVTQGQNVKLASLGPLSHGRNDAGHFQKLHDRIVRESLYVVELNPSYGCSLVGVARNIRMDAVT